MEPRRESFLRRKLYRGGDFVKIKSLKQYYMHFFTLYIRAFDLSHLLIELEEIFFAKTHFDIVNKKLRNEK